MSLAEFIRVMDLSWLKFFYGTMWILIFVGIYTASIMSSAFLSGQESYKKTLPRKYKEQDEQIKDLKAELKTTIKERDGYEDRLKAISLSSEVRGKR